MPERGRHRQGWTGRAEQHECRAAWQARPVARRRLQVTRAKARLSTASAAPSFLTQRASSRASASRCCMRSHAVLVAGAAPEVDAGAAGVEEVRGAQCALDLRAPVAAAQVHGHRLPLLPEERLACMHAKAPARLLLPSRLCQTGPSAEHAAKPWQASEYSLLGARGLLQQSPPHTEEHQGARHVRSARELPGCGGGAAAHSGARAVGQDALLTCKSINAHVRHQTDAKLRRRGGGAPRSLGREGRMRSSARNRSYAPHRARLASCDSYLVRSLLVPMTLATPAASPAFSRFFAALCPSPAHAKH